MLLTNIIYLVALGGLGLAIVGLRLAIGAKDGIMSLWDRDVSDLDGIARFMVKFSLVGGLMGGLAVFGAGMSLVYLIMSGQIVVS